MLSDRQNELNPECEPLWVNLATICFELCIENPFVMDLIKSETFDWEVNDHLYMGKEAADAPNNKIGALAGLLTHLLELQRKKQVMFKQLLTL